MTAIRSELFRAVQPSSQALPCHACGSPDHSEITAPWYCILQQALLSLTNILVLGAPSVGKSTTLRNSFANALRMTITNQTGADLLVGTLQSVNGDTKGIDGISAVAMRHGRPVIFEEIDRIGPEGESLLFNILDDRPHLNMPTGEFLEAKEGFKVVMTSNMNPQGAMENAVIDRFQAFILADIPHENAYGELTGHPEFDKALKGISLNHYQGQEMPAIALPPTVRRIRTFAKLLRDGMLAEHASQIVFGNAAQYEIQSAISNVFAVQVNS
jgi:MoxR-like ATPase